MYNSLMSAPLSSFYKSGNLIFISGKVGSDPETQVIPEDFESQARNLFQNLKSGVLEVDL